MKTLLQSLYKSAFTALFVCFSLAFSWPVAVDHPVNAFIKKMELKGLIDIQGLNTLPLQSGVIQDALILLEKKSSQLAPLQRKKLRYFLIEYGITKDPSLYPLRYKERYSKIKTSDAGSTRRSEQKPFSRDVKSIHFSGFYDLDYAQSDSNDAQYGTLWDIIGGQFEGQWGENISYQAQAGVIRDYSSEARFSDTYDPSLGLPYNTPDNRLGEGAVFTNASQDAFRAIFSWTPDIFTLEFGQDWNQWGPGIVQHSGISSSGYLWLQDSLNNDQIIGPNNSLTDSSLYTPYWKSVRRGYFKPGQAPPMPQFRIRMDWGKVTYLQFAAQRQGLIHNPKAMLFGHRIEVKLHDWKLGIYELISTSREDNSWTYWTPLVPYFVAEHHTGDRDNTTLGLDVDYKIINNLRAYTELFLDDMLSPTEIHKNYWGNKYALTIGFEWIDFFTWGNSFQLEYARVEPWLFSHVTADNQFQNHGFLIGSSLPPNSHQVFSSYTQNIFDILAINLAYTWQQHQLYDRGSSILDLHSEEFDSATKVFLGEKSKTSHIVDASVIWAPWYYSDFEAGLRYVNNSNQGVLANQSSEINTIWLKTSVRY